ncbi:MAG: TIM barrel protein, partial [Phycisphaerae bacterium]
MPTLAFSTNAYTRFTLGEACDRIAAAGYTGVEVLADVPHAYPLRFGDQEARRLRERLDALGLAPVALNGNTAMGYWDPVPEELTFEPSLVSGDEARREARIRIIEAALALAAHLGAPVVTITTGRPLSDEPAAVLRARLLKGLERVLRAADLAG